MGWLALIAAALALGLFGVWRYALATNAVYLLDGVDRIAGGTQGTRLALAQGTYGALPAQRVEIVTPDLPAPQPLPVVIFFHGGAWNSGSPGDYHFVGRTFARAGYAVVLAGYRLTPDGAYPHMLEDGAKAAAWTRANIARFGGDPERVFLMGHSAGAHTAAMLSLERQWLGREGLPDGFVKGMVGLSGPYDFLPFTTDSARAAFGKVADPAVTQPVRFARGDAAPMLLLTGSADTTVKPRNTAALAAAIRAAGGSAEAVTVDGADHSDTVMKLAAPFSRDRRVLDPVLAFLAAHGGASAPVQAGSR
jgi:acetyl esterase/lipase